MWGAHGTEWETRGLEAENEWKRGVSVAEETAEILHGQSVKIADSTPLDT